MKENKKVFKSVDEVRKHYFPKSYARGEFNKKKEKPVHVCRSLLKHGTVVVG